MIIMMNDDHDDDSDGDKFYSHVKCTTTIKFTSIFLYPLRLDPLRMFGMNEQSSAIYDSRIVASRAAVLTTVLVIRITPLLPYVFMI